MARILERDLAEIASVVAAKAKAGDMRAAQIVFDFLTPKPGERPLEFDLRRIDNAEDAAAALNDVLQALAGGRIALVEAERIVRLLRGVVAAMDLAFFGDGPSRQAYKAEWMRRRRSGASFESEETERILQGMSDADLKELERSLRHEMFFQNLYEAAKEGRTADVVNFYEAATKAGPPDPDDYLPGD